MPTLELYNIFWRDKNCIQQPPWNTVGLRALAWHDWERLGITSWEGDHILAGEGSHHAESGPQTTGHTGKLSCGWVWSAAMRQNWREAASAITGHESLTNVCLFLQENCWSHRKIVMWLGVVGCHWRKAAPALTGQKSLTKCLFVLTGEFQKCLSQNVCLDRIITKEIPSFSN